MDMIMNSPLEVELTAALKGHMTPNVMIQYGHPNNPKYRFRTHKDVLFNCSATFKRKFNSRELVSQLNHHFLFPSIQGPCFLTCQGHWIYHHYFS